MKKTIAFTFLAVFLGITLLPVLFAQLSKEEERELQGVNLDELTYQEISFYNAEQDLDLGGMLFVPEGEGPFPAVVVIQGAGNSVRDNYWYLTMTQYLQENGILVLLPDKRGSVKSEGDWRTSSFEDLATDTLAAISYLKGQNQVAISQIGIIGMSQGGQLSPLVAVQSPDVAFLVDVVGTSLPLYDELHYEETNNLREIGFLPGVSDLIAYPSTYVLRKFRQKDFWDAVGNFDALPYWQKLSIPALVMYGGADSNVPAEASKARLDELNKDNITVNIYEGSGHALEDPPGAGNDKFRKEALMDIEKFIHTVVPPAIRFAAPQFVFQGEDPSVPVVTRNPSPEIENQYINPGAVLYHAGKFHMFFNSFSSWPGTIEVGYMTSEDGYHWQMEQNAPVFTTDQIPFGNGQADVSSVLVAEDGTWVMYFHTISKGQIGRATAASPLGPWSVEADPVLEPGPSGAWDENGVFWPNVVPDRDGYRMYYGGKNDLGTAIGLATSSDGITWTKYNDPETTGELYAESDPVLTVQAAWELKWVDRPRVTRSPDGWVMIYQAGHIEMRGLALSNDGIDWQTYPSNPLFTSDSFPIPRAKTWDTTLLYHEGVYYYFMELGSLSGTDIYLTAHQGSLRK